MTTTGTTAMRPLLFPDDHQFWYETLRALGHRPSRPRPAPAVVVPAADPGAALTPAGHCSW